MTSLGLWFYTKWYLLTANNAPYIKPLLLYAVIPTAVADGGTTAAA